MTLVRVQTERFDVDNEIEAATLGRRDVGAVVSFVGLCRDEGGTLDALDIEHYPGMAEAEIEATTQEAWRRWSLQALTVIHRYGSIAAGEPIVLVVAAAAHRGEAFAAAEFLMDYLKTRAPFWKRERRLDGSFGDWVGANEQDDRALERWRAH